MTKKQSKKVLKEMFKKTFSDPVIFRKGRNYDLLREGLVALD